MLVEMNFLWLFLKVVLMLLKKFFFDVCDGFGLVWVDLFYSLFVVIICGDLNFSDMIVFVDFLSFEVECL